jgi:DNA-binding PadR family transcriptional regulator
VTYYTATRYIVRRYIGKRNKLERGENMATDPILKHLPLTEATYYIMLALVTPKHGYAVMQEAQEISQGTLRLAPGTTYGALTSLEQNKLISMVGKEGRRKIYQLTESGIRVLLGQIQRMEIMLQSAARNFDLWQQLTSEEDK